MKKIGITGADGFVGSHLVKKLEAAGYELQLSTVNLDLEMPDFTGCAHVLHLAARTFVPDSWENPHLFYQTNTQGTAKVLEAVRQAGASMTFISSYVYGAPQYLPIDEKHPLAPANPYMQSKVLGEQLCDFYRDNFGVKICILRPFNLYGSGLADKFLIPLICQQVMDEQQTEVRLRSLKPKRDYVHIDDLVNAIAASIEAKDAATVNIASGSSYSVQELADMIMTISGIQKPVVSTMEERPNEIMDTKADISLAKEFLNWQPEISIEEGIRQIIEDMRKS